MFLRILIIASIVLSLLSSCQREIDDFEREIVFYVENPPLKASVEKEKTDTGSVVEKKSMKNKQSRDEKTGADPDGINF